jgi:hypothetical protein
MQMTFPSPLQFRVDADTLLLGRMMHSGVRVFAAFDVRKHRTFGTSPSLQVKLNTLQRAIDHGMALQYKPGNQETVVAFTADRFNDYLNQMHGYHSFDATDLANLEETLQVEEPRSTPQRLLEGTGASRERIASLIPRWARDRAFSREVRRYYDQCAICHLHLSDVIEAAHINPVADQGTDTLDNALGVCPLCHRLYDAGLVLVDDQMNITLAPAAAVVSQITSWVKPRLWTPSTLPTGGMPSSQKLGATYSKRRRP